MRYKTFLLLFTLIVPFHVFLQENQYCIPQGQGAYGQSTSYNFSSSIAGIEGQENSLFYSDKTNTPFRVYAGESVVLFVDATFFHSNALNNIARSYSYLFVDWGNDFSFDEASDYMGSFYLGNLSIVIPVTLSPGEYRMRLVVSNDYLRVVLPCEVGNGNVIDFTLLIEERYICPGLEATLTGGGLICDGTLVSGGIQLVDVRSSSPVLVVLNYPSGSYEYSYTNNSQPLPIEAGTITIQAIYNQTCRIGGRGSGRGIGSVTFVESRTVTVEQSQTICQGTPYTIGPFSYSEAGKYYSYLSQVNGCDSIVITTLTVLPSKLNITTVGHQLIQLPVSNASYEWVDCHTNQVLGSLNVFSPSRTGSYKLRLLTEDCTEESECYQIDFLETSKVDDHSFAVYPNPTKGVVHIQAFDLEIISIDLMDLNGRLIDSYTQMDNWENIDLAFLQEGIYLLQIHTIQGMVTKKINKIR